MQILNKNFLKKLSQIFFLIVFLLLFINTSYQGENIIKYPVNIFLRADPLVFLTTLDDSKTRIILAIPSLIFVILTLFLGRFFCWWVCPLGTIFDLLSNKKLVNLKFGRFINKIRNLRFYILIFFLIGSILLSIQLIWLMDPIVMLIRFLTLSITPFFTKYLFNLAFLTGVIFISILLINLFYKRFWCISFCPLGALYSLISKIGIKRKSEKINFERRGLLLTGISSLILIPMLKFGPNKKFGLLRPPGTPEDEEFLEHCIRCGECMKVCPTNALQPALLESGIDGIYSPKFFMRNGYCEYNCNLCGQVCPTGAIENLTLQKKQKYVIGLAYIDKNRCYPFKEGINCLVCEEHCPTPDKAIKFRLYNYSRLGKLVKEPYVISDLCIGCGICETKCPVEGNSAIVVEPHGLRNGDILNQKATGFSGSWVNPVRKFSLTG